MTRGWMRADGKGEKRKRKKRSQKGKLGAAGGDSKGAVAVEHSRSAWAAMNTRQSMSILGEREAVSATEEGREATAGGDDGCAEKKDPRNQI